jgi:hypothetical protein
MKWLQWNSSMAIANAQMDTRIRKRWNAIMLIAQTVVRSVVLRMTDFVQDAPPHRIGF